MAVRDLNTVFLVGRLTRDPEFKMTAAGKELLKFSIANNRVVGGGNESKEEVSYFDVSLWGKIAVIMKDFLTKGKQVAVQGRLIQSRWEQEGQTRSKVEIMADNIQLFGSGGSGGSGSTPGPVGNGQYSGPANNYDAGPSTDDIPF